MSQKEKILKLLKESPNGVSNFELNEICFRYGARIFELRKEGYPISSTHGKKQSEWIFKLEEGQLKLAVM